jgi:hypothetical protein
MMYIFFYFLPMCREPNSLKRTPTHLLTPPPLPPQALLMAISLVSTSLINTKHAYLRPSSVASASTVLKNNFGIVTDISEI